MILGDPAPATPGPAQSAAAATLDTLFRGLVQRRPDAVALVDPANRKSFTDGESRLLTFAETDRVVTAIAGRLRRMGLPTDSVVGIQLPNIVDHIVAVLGVVRAGMIAAPMPLLWRRADAVTAMARVGAKALITCGHVGAFHHAEFAMRVAAEVFSIRYVCAFGTDVPDGVVPFDDLFARGMPDPLVPLQRASQDDAAAHVAIVTFDIGERGPVPVARTHSELIAGGLAVLLESRLAPDSNILSAIAPTSVAGMAMAPVPWLMSGGTLVLHHPFDPDVFAGQRQDYRCRTLVLPGPVAFRLAEAGAFAGDDAVTVIAAWRAPDRLAASAGWRQANAVLLDVPIFGEAALLPARRGGSGRPRAPAFGPLRAPRDHPEGIVVAELLRTESGTLAVRGPMVPSHAFPPGVERAGLALFRIGRGGFIDTGYTCRVDTVSKAIVITGPPAGLVAVGGYRFPLPDLQDLARRTDSAATLAALPDPLLGQRLIGNAADRDTMQAALSAAGVNPLVVAAFRDRSAPDASPSAPDLS